MKNIFNLYYDFFAIGCGGEVFVQIDEIFNQNFKVFFKLNLAAFIFVRCVFCIGRILSFLDELRTFIYLHHDSAFVF